MGLEIYHDSTKISERVENYLDDSYDIATFAKDTQFIWVGYYKPINSLYVESLQNVATPLRNTMKLEYNKSGVWTGVGQHRDDTRGFERSGYISWARNLPDETPYTHQATNLFWYRISVTDLDIDSLNIKGINLVFADDRDLAGEFPSVKLFLGDLKSFIGFHQAARDEIITDFRNHGKFVKGKEDFYKKLDQFDMLDFEEIRQAAKFKALEKLFFWLSDAPDDKYSQRQAFYKGKYDYAKNQAFLSIDKNDDGKADTNERGEIQFTRITRE